jgi:hypothetical protein
LAWPLCIGGEIWLKLIYLYWCKNMCKLWFLGNFRACAQKYTTKEKLENNISKVVATTTTHLTTCTNFQLWCQTCATFNYYSIIIATLTLGSRPRQGLARGWAKRKLRSHISCFRECKRVWGNKPSHSQGSSHFGSWNPSGLSNFQRTNARVKTPWIEKILIPLEIS